MSRIAFSIQYAIHCIDFHETHIGSMALCREFLLTDLIVTAPNFMKI